MSEPSEINVEKLDIQILELLRLEFEIQEDIEKQQQDLLKVRHQRELLEAQIKLIKEGRLSQETE